MQIAKKVIDGRTLTFHWADETTTVFTPEDFSPEIQERAMMAGFGHKFGDAYSGAKGDVRTAQMMQLEVVQACKDGDWNRKGGGFSTGGIIIEAIARATGEEIDHVLAKWNEMSDEVKKDTKAHPQVKLAKAEIEMERAKAKAKDAKPIAL
jgi:hypothetical protein